MAKNSIMFTKDQGFFFGGVLKNGNAFFPKITNMN